MEDPYRASFGLLVRGGSRGRFHPRSAAVLPPGRTGRFQRCAPLWGSADGLLLRRLCGNPCEYRLYALFPGLSSGFFHPRKIFRRGKWMVGGGLACLFERRLPCRLFSAAGLLPPHSAAPPENFALPVLTWRRRRHRSRFASSFRRVPFHRAVWGLKRWAEMLGDGPGGGVDDIAPV